jgi:hypothetical protein
VDQWFCGEWLHGRNMIITTGMSKSYDAWQAIRKSTDIRLSLRLIKGSMDSLENSAQDGVCGKRHVPEFIGW